jgi:hypothetical protein
LVVVVLVVDGGELLNNAANICDERKVDLRIEEDLAGNSHALIQGTILDLGWRN